MLPRNDASEATRVGYVLKRYPRYSETFVVNEILAHEAAGLTLEIFSLYPPADSHFQDGIARVRAPVSYLASQRPKASDLWAQLTEAQRVGLDTTAFLAMIGSEDARDACWALELALAVQQRGLTHLHAHFASVATTVARLAARLSGVPFSFTAHAKDIFHESVVADNLRQKLEDAGGVVTVSEFNRSYLQERFGSAASNVRCVYNGMDLTRFGYCSPAARPPEIIGVGRLVQKKGFEDLVAACASLKAQGRDFHCRIVGAGELEDALRRQIKELGLEAQVELLGPKPQRELAALVQGSAVLAAPCVVGDDGNRDGLPTVLLEAMALGTPCISTDVTGIPELLENEVTGLMVPQREPEALAAALGRTLDDAALRCRLAEGARRRIERDFDVTHSAAAVRQLFSAHEVAAREEVWA